MVGVCLHGRARGGCRRDDPGPYTPYHTCGSPVDAAGVDRAPTQIDQEIVRVRVTQGSVSRVRIEAKIRVYIAGLPVPLGELDIQFVLAIRSYACRWTVNKAGSNDAFLHGRNGALKHIVIAS